MNNNCVSVQNNRAGAALGQWPVERCGYPPDGPAPPLKGQGQSGQHGVVRLRFGQPAFDTDIESDVFGYREDQTAQNVSRWCTVICIRVPFSPDVGNEDEI